MKLKKTNLSKKQRAALSCLRSKLDVNDPGFRGSGEVRAALMHCENYFRSWVLPLLDAMENTDPHHPYLCFTDDIVREAATVERVRKLGYLNHEGDMQRMRDEGIALFAKQKSSVLALQHIADTANNRGSTLAAILDVAERGLTGKFES